MWLPQVNSNASQAVVLTRLATNGRSNPGIDRANLPDYRNGLKA
jgi:hypothetical protein